MGIKYYIKRHSKKLIHYWKEDKIIFTKHLFRLGGMIISQPYKKFIRTMEDMEYDIKVKHREEIRKRIHGSIMYLPTKDVGLSRDLILNGTRENNSVEVFNREFKPHMQTIDIGANIGYYALMEARKVSEGEGRVCAIEPHPKAFSQLKKNMEANKYLDKGSKIILMNIGIGEKKESKEFYMSHGWNWSRFKKGEGNDELEEIRVTPLDTLDNLFKNKRIDFIRMDVEGYEFHIFKGASQLIKNNPQIKIFLEFHANHFTKPEREEFIDFLKEHNLEVKYFFSGNRNKFKKREYDDIRNAMYKTYYLLLEGKGNDDRN